jgi:hypothetical protein
MPEAYLARLPGARRGPDTVAGRAASLLGLSDPRRTMESSTETERCPHPVHRFIHSKRKM